MGETRNKEVHPCYPVPRQGPLSSWRLRHDGPLPCGACFSVQGKQVRASLLISES